MVERDLRGAHRSPLPPSLMLQPRTPLTVPWGRRRYAGRGKRQASPLHGFPPATVARHGARASRTNDRLVMNQSTCVKVDARASDWTTVMAAPCQEPGQGGLPCRLPHPGQSRSSRAPTSRRGPLCRPGFVPPCSLAWPSSGVATGVRLQERPRMCTTCAAAREAPASWRGGAATALGYATVDDRFGGFGGAPNFAATVLTSCCVPTAASATRRARTCHQYARIWPRGDSTVGGGSTYSWRRCWSPLRRCCTTTPSWPSPTGGLPATGGRYARCR